MKHDVCKEGRALKRDTALSVEGGPICSPERQCLCSENSCAVADFAVTLLEIQAQRLRFARDCKTARETLAFGVAAE